MQTEPTTPIDVAKLSREQRLELVSWMFSLEFDEVNKRARRSLGEVFPTATAEMLKTAEFHVYVDGRDAALNWLAELARFLKAPDGKPPSAGYDWELLNHLYNWWQFRALIPLGKTDLRDLIGDVKTLIEENELESAMSALREIEDCLDGNVEFPRIDEK